MLLRQRRDSVKKLITVVTQQVVSSLCRKIQLFCHNCLWIAPSLRIAYLNPVVFASLAHDRDVIFYVEKSRLVIAPHLLTAYYIPFAFPKNAGSSSCLSGIRQSLQIASEPFSMMYHCKLKICKICTVIRLTIEGSFSNLATSIIPFRPIQLSQMGAFPAEDNRSDNSR